MNYMLATKISYTSARALSTLLGLKVTASPNKLKGDLKIRYGNSLPTNQDETNVINPSQAIKLCSNSELFSTFCKKNDIFSPDYIPIQEAVMQDTKFPVLLRDKYHHQGLDIEIIENLESLLKVKNIYGRFMVNFYPTTFEIGVHVCNGKVLKIFKKEATENCHPFIRNIRCGYHFSVVNNLNDNFILAQRVVLEAFDKIGLTFGRADVGYIKKLKKYIIFEINTAPGLNDLTADLYAKELREMIL